MKVYFATTNEGKLKEARSILGIEVIPAPLEIDEIQSMDTNLVAIKKARAYYEILKKPIVVEDFAFHFSALNGFPGPYISDLLKSIGNSGIIKILNAFSDRSAKGITTLVYIDKKGEEHIFLGEVNGKIALKEKGDKGFGWDPIFIPDGDTRTFGEMETEEKNKYSMRGIAFEKFKAWLIGEKK